MLKRIKVQDLRPGMYIHEFCGSWLDHPFWRKKFLLRKAEDIRRIVDSGIAELWIDVSKGLDVAERLGETPSEASPALDLPPIEPASADPPRVSVAEEVQRAAVICGKAREAVIAMFNDVRMGQAIQADSAGQLVDEISASVTRNPVALVGLARLRAIDDYTYMHSVSVCALMICLARQLGLDAETAREAGLAGLLHDVGKAVIPTHILNKPSGLSDEERAMMMEHSVAGHRALADSQSVGDILLDVCLHHHEKVDGSGYPKGLKGEEISLFSRMAAVCDVYDAITSDRPYKLAWHPAEAMRKMAEWSAGHFDWQVFQAFVKSVGIYPVGSLVRLSSDRLGVVVSQGEASLLAPKVRAFYSTRNRSYITPDLIDLSSPSCPEKITGYEQADKWGIARFDQFWMNG